MKTFIILTITLFNSFLCFSQNVIEVNLTKEIEDAKNNFRIVGLNEIDEIEGIYYVNRVEERKVLVDEYAYLNGTSTDSVYLIIKRNYIDRNRFDITQYFENNENGNSSSKVISDWYIKKENSRYFINYSQTSDFINYESKVNLYDNKIYFKRETKATSYQGTFIITFTTIKKIFPTNLEENIFKSGTGFFISQNGYLVTNYHVIEKSTNIYVSNQNYNRIKAQVVFSDEFNDIAILKVSISLKTIPYNIDFTNKEIGSNVFTLGYPYIQTMGKEVKLTNGIINSNSGYENDIRYYQFSAEIQPGNSGGPLFDSNGNIVGLVSAKHSKATNAGYALKSKFLIEFIKINNPALLKINNNTIKNMTLSAKYKVLQNYIVLLEIE
ncbi:MAG: serine protease [Bacteroidetes bacterium]|nr:serine protease [Bacteroidota bacterium]